MMALSIPADIIYVILDELSSDTASLKECSLVSRPFLSQCRKHLFSHIRLNHFIRCRGLYCAISANPSLAGYVRTFEVATSVVSELRGRYWVTIEPTLAPLIQALHNLHSFTLRHTVSFPLSWTSLPYDLRHAILTISAPCLNLVFLSNIPIGHFGRLTGLRSLSLRDIFFDSKHELDLTILDSPHQSAGYLEWLKILRSPTCARHLVSTLTDPRSLLRLTKLKDLILNGNGGFGSAIMDAAGPALERVIWAGLGEESDGPLFTFPKSFTHLPALRLLTISTKFARGHSHDPLPLLAHALAHAAPRDACALTCLTIHIDFYGVWKFATTPRDIEAVEQYAFWPALDEALTRPGVYTRLERVTIALNVGGGREAFSRLPGRRMARLMESGVLKMAYGIH